MSRLLVSLGIFICILLVAGLLYFYRSGIMLAPSHTDAPLGRTITLSAEFEEQLMYYLVTKLNIFEGNFEILDVVSLSAQNFTGADYILISLRAPDGRICQVTARRSGRFAGAWEFDDKSFNIVGLAQYEPGSAEDDSGLMQELNDNLEKNKLFALLKADFFKEELVADESQGSGWLNFEPLPEKNRLSINERKKIGFSNQMSPDTGPDSLWKPDYPSQYSGPGYRSYLYEKMKGKR